MRWQPWIIVGGLLVVTATGALLWQDIAGTGAISDRGSGQPALTQAGFMVSGPVWQRTPVPTTTNLSSPPAISDEDGPVTAPESGSTGVGIGTSSGSVAIVWPPAVITPAPDPTPQPSSTPQPRPTFQPVPTTSPSPCGQCGGGGPHPGVMCPMMQANVCLYSAD